MPTKLSPEKETIVNESYNPIDDEKKVRDEFSDRKKELLNSRKNIHGLNIDEQMRDWDNKYFNREADIAASELDIDQKPVAVNNAFAKIQTALSIMIESNPDFTLDEKLPQYSANNQLIRALLRKSWQRTDSLYQFILFVFNMSKRGWACGRTYHKYLDHTAKFRVAKQGKEEWEERTIIKQNDIAFQNLDNHNVWIDEEARPFDFFSIRDWMWREVWHISKVRRLFPESEFLNMKFVKEGGNVSETPDGTSQTGGTSGQQQKEMKKGMTELFFYENQFSDRFIVEINGVMVVSEPLPQWHKRLSLVSAFWNLRSAETIYGIGILEEIEKDEKLIDRILNMTLRQLILCIQPMGFYNGTDDFERENLKIKPGVLRRVQGNPKDISWLQVPPPDGKGMEMIEHIESKEDQNTGINKQLAGEIEQLPRGETAYAMGMSREAGLKRLKLPLKSLQYSFSWEARNRADLIKQVYSKAEVERITDAKDIMDYLSEVNADKKFYFIENEGKAGKEVFYAYKFPEEKLGVEKGDKGQYLEGKEERFFKLTPEMLSWEGDIWIDMESMLVHSDELEKLDTVRMVNLLKELIELPPELQEKWMKQILSAFKKDPKKWLPDDFTNLMQQKQQEGQIKGETPPAGQIAGMDKKVSLGKRMSAAYNAFQVPVE